MDIVRKRIIERATELGLDYKDISLQMGRNHAYLQQFLTRGIPRELKERDRERLASILRVNEEEIGGPRRSHPFETPTRDIVTEDGKKAVPADTTPEIDVTAGLGGGGLSTHVTDSNGNGLTFTSELVRDYWRLPSWLHDRINVPPRHLAAFTVQGDSMEPTLASGDTVFIDTRHRVPSPDGIYAIVDLFGGLIVKRLEVRDDRVSVISDNPRHSEYTMGIEELMVIGRYVGRFTV
ncbi:S24 family peptidase [Stappia sp.]|uniref:S24 family peptidase n=1 Tax=Stappia sp. TaxID=1870903 RepID=UPI0025CDB9C4|nr:S24 family peptidase [Stappia sp.]|tara:strand:+ start:86 stop:793 length:708 start_codon:yes stop_codon:yes gene_type:complete